MSKTKKPPAKVKRNPRFKVGKPAVPLTVEPRVSDFEVYRDINRGLPLNQVAKSHGIDWHTAKGVKDRMDEYFRREFWDDIVKLKADHSAKLLDLYCETRQAFEASKNPTVKTQTKPGKVPDGATLEECLELPDEVTVTETTTSGDPRFAAEARAALSDIRKIWGADAPIKLEHSGELRVAGKTQEEADAAIIEHVQGLLKELAN